MINPKSIIILILIFCFQTIMSCDPCDCPSLRKYSVDFQDMDVAAYQRIDGTYRGITDNIAFSDLILISDVAFEAFRLSQYNKNMGFSSALACDCVFPTKYQYVDAIVSIRILKTDQEAIEDISVLFGIDESFDLEWFIENNLFVNTPEQILSLQFNARNDASLTGTTTLTVEIELESGAVLSSTTQEITFTN